MCADFVKAFLFISQLFSELCEIIMSRGIEKRNHQYIQIQHENLKMQFLRISVNNTVP